MRGVPVSVRPRSPSVECIGCGACKEHGGQSHRTVVRLSGGMTAKVPAAHTHSCGHAARAYARAHGGNSLDARSHVSQAAGHRCIFLSIINTCTSTGHRDHLQGALPHDGGGVGPAVAGCRRAVPRMVHAWAAFSLLHGSQHSKSIFTHDAERAARPSAQRPPFSSLHPRHCLGPSLVCGLD